MDYEEETKVMERWPSGATAAMEAEGASSCVVVIALIVSDSSAGDWWLDGRKDGGEF